MSNTVLTGRRALRMEGEAVLLAADHLDDGFATAIECLASASRVVVSGIGKSWLIAQKIAATLTSTGTPAIGLHPVESLHGDLGLVQPGTAAIVLSKSGETEELFGLLANLARLDTPVIAITGNPDSTLARAAMVVLDASVSEEACPLDLAPTTSSTVALALGDALAVALLEHKGFKREDFAHFHPGGSLGRRLLLRVSDVMLPGPQGLAPETPMNKVAVSLARERGLALVMDGEALVGVITAGDLTRLAGRSETWPSTSAAEVMTTNPQVVYQQELAAAAVGMMERNAIMAAPVLDENRKVVGVIHLHDLLRAGAA